MNYNPQEEFNECLSRGLILPRTLERLTRTRRSNYTLNQLYEWYGVDGMRLDHLGRAPSAGYPAEAIVELDHVLPATRQCELDRLILDRDGIQATINRYNLSFDRPYVPCNLPQLIAEEIEREARRRA